VSVPRNQITQVIKTINLQAFLLPFFCENNLWQIHICIIKERMQQSWSFPAQIERDSHVIPQ
jgi:hypothetical protein